MIPESQVPKQLKGPVPMHKYNVHIFNEKGEDSVFPFDANDYNVTENGNLEIILESTGSAEDTVIATFNEWAFIEQVG